MSPDTNAYHFVTRWSVPGTCGEVADVLGDPLALPRWWPSVYLRVDQLEPPGADGVGRRVRLHTKGWLPYTLTWELVTVEQFYPNRIVLDAFGDFVGRGIWTFVQDGPNVTAIYDWRIRAEKPLLQRLSWILKPVFEANHRWAMAQGEESLRLELRRRRTLSDDARAAIPPPPGPVTYAGVVVLGAVALGVVGAAYLVRRARHARRARRDDDRESGHGTRR